MWRIRAISTITLLAFVGAGIGFPMPARLVRPDDDFPCRYHGCGCLTAEMCRTDCCCTPTKKIETTKKSCCSDKTSETCDQTEDQNVTESTTVVIGALKCKGQAGKWLSLPPTLNLTAFLSTIDADSGEPSFHIVRGLYSLTDIPPPSPPPRSA